MIIPDIYLVNRWKGPIFDNSLGKPITDLNSIVLCACLLESQSVYNKHLIPLNIYQRYTLPLIRIIIGELDADTIHTSYIEAHEVYCELAGRGVKVNNPKKIDVDITDPYNCVNGQDIETLIMENVRFVVTPIVLDAIKNGESSVGPLFHIEEPSNNNITVHINI